MKILYAPWRSSYTQKTVREKQNSPCPFCKAISEDDDEKNFILHRFKYHIVILNIFPYNAGHVLIVSLDHVATLQNLGSSARAELMEITNTVIEIFDKVLKPQGINVGINLGKIAGAGIPEHFHEHILPRWQGDTNFLPALSQTKQISFDLHEMYKKLKPSF